MKRGVKGSASNALHVPGSVNSRFLPVSSRFFLLSCSSFFNSFLHLPNHLRLPLLLLSRPIVLNLLPPCLVPVVLGPIIPGNGVLLVAPSSLQQFDAHPSPVPHPPGPSCASHGSSSRST